MSRNIQVTLPSERTEDILPKIQGLKGLIGLKVHRNISVQPEGDVLDLDLLNSEVNGLLILLEREGLLNHEKVSITTSRPTNVISMSHSNAILGETHESSWEDMLQDLLQESSMNLNTMLLMLFSGFLAAVGISTNSIHIVIGAMLIAPGFEPISRFVMGLVAGHKDWKNGGLDILKGYSILIIGGITGASAMKFFGIEVLPGSSSYLPAGVLVDYWTKFSTSSLVISSIASLAGGIIIMTNKSILTAGVMVALALIPAATLIGMGLVEGNPETARTAFLRLATEIALVAFFTGAIFLWKRFTTQKRRMRA